MQLDLKKNWPVVVGVSIPILMIIIVVVSIYLPAWFNHPKYNFIYLDRGQNQYTYTPAGCAQPDTYTVSNGHISAVQKQSNPYKVPNNIYNGYNNGSASLSVPPPLPPACPAQSQPQFYFYNVNDNQAYQISADQAMAYQLDPSSQSPDGYTVDHGSYSGGDFLFGGGGTDNYYKMFIKGHNFSKQLNLKGAGINSYSAYASFQFMGWVIQ